jgi:hypothetical protein
MLNPARKVRGKPAPAAKRKWELDSDDEDEVDEHAEPSEAMKALQAELHEKVTNNSIFIVPHIFEQQQLVWNER